MRRALPSSFPIHHGGFDNFMVVLDWMRKRADKPEQILVAGSSAGGYGASTNFPWVQRAFPKAKMAVLADAVEEDAEAAGRLMFGDFPVDFMLTVATVDNYAQAK